MENYIGVKMVYAKPMNRQQYNDFRGWKLPDDECGSDDGFLVEYVDGGRRNTAEYNGYVSWSPKDVFENSYRRTTGLTFGLAIEALKQGKQVTRKGWNGKGMFLWLKPATTINEDWCKDELLKTLCEQNGGKIEALGTVCMYTTNNTGRKAILTGWLASQTDMLSEDWEIIE